jgi:hypothetical protein
MGKDRDSRLVGSSRLAVRWMMVVHGMVSMN